MLNIHDLERRWLRYKIKTYIPIVLGSIGVAIILILTIIYIPTLIKEEKKTTTIKREPATIEKNTSVVSVQQIKTVEPIKNKIIQKVENINDESKDYPQNNSLVLKPSLHFMDNIEDDISPYIEDSQVQEMEPIESTKVTTDIPTISTNEETTIAVSTVKVKKEGLTLSVQREESAEELKDVVRRFKKNKNPTLSLFIAKRYYKLGNYQKSYNYALMTNQIDKNIEESWIIFSKSLVKLKQKELAINTLNAYLKNTKSTAAQVLLRKIRSGDFK